MWQQIYWICKAGINIPGSDPSSSLLESSQIIKLISKLIFEHQLSPVLSIISHDRSSKNEKQSVSINLYSSGELSSKTLAYAVIQAGNQECSGMWSNTEMLRMESTRTLRQDSKPGAINRQANDSSNFYQISKRKKHGKNLLQERIEK